ncbi:hypothetical protein ACTVCO_10230 [Sanguibacter sp. A247]|uniref:hypothetical protein n=1 Tax=unclassified Sanguibacter TaxID=2645534 RepID=UPI003FD8FCA6
MRAYGTRWLTNETSAHESKIAGKRGTGTWLGPTDVAFGTTGPGPCEGLDEMMPSED